MSYLGILPRAEEVRVHEVLPGLILQFGEFELDCGRFELQRKGQPLRVERKPMELLLLLAGRKGQLVTRKEIAERLWSSEVFVDTEHGINTAIRKLRFLLRDDPDEPRFIQTVTGMGYRFVVPVTCIEAPSSEPAAAVSTDTTIPEEMADEEGPGQPRTAKRLRLWMALCACGVLVAAILALFAGPHPLAARLFHRGTQPPFTSIAVLPLDNLSGDPNQEYFADGMTDELITMLAKESTLRITSRTSVMQYKGAHRPLPEIARALKVDGILEGSVSRSGTRVHVTLQLIRADSDTHMWAESYDRDGNDAAIPEEAAEAIAKRLHSATVASAPARYVNPAAHDAYLQGKYLWFSDDHMEESGKYFQKAIEMQPDYALAWAWLALYYGAGTVSGILDPRTSLAPMEAAAKHAMELDPNLAESHQAMTGAYFFQDWNFAAADREILEAIRLDPNNAELYHLRAKLLSVLNRNGEAIENEKKGMEINPFERPWGMVHTYTSARQFDAAIEDGRLRLKGYPTDRSLLYMMTEAYRRKGMYKEAVEAWVQFHEVIGDRESAAELKSAYDTGGYRGFVQWQLARAMQITKKSYVTPVVLACYHAQLGEREAALALLEEGYKQRSPDLLWIQTDPAFDSLHTDPRYRSLVQRIGLPPA